MASAYDRNKAAYDAFVSGSGKYDDAGVYLPGGDKLTKDEYETVRKRYQDAMYTPEQDLSQFETLLGKLEGSKMKQAEQANRARRGDIYSQGIAQMMSNF
jgi:hypothetical protein